MKVYADPKVDDMFGRYVKAAAVAENNIGQPHEAELWDEADYRHAEFIAAYDEYLARQADAQMGVL